MESPDEGRSPELEEQQHESAEDSITQSVDEPVPGDPTDPVPGDPTDPVPEDSTDPVSWDPADPVSEDPTDPVPGDPTDPVPEDSTDPVSWDPANPVPGDPTDPVSEDPADPVSEDPADPVSEDPADPVPEDPTDPVSGDPADPVPEDPADPVPEDPTDPVSGDPADPQLYGENYAPEDGPCAPVSPDQNSMTPEDNYIEEEEEEELIVLGPDHELVQRYQTALSVELKKELERINAALKEKNAELKADEAEREERSMEIYRINQTLVGQQNKLNDLQEAKDEAKNKHLRALDQLDVNRAQFSSITDEVNQKQAHVSQLQAELDNLMQTLTFTQEENEKLQSNIKTLRNVSHKAEAEKFQAEEQKLKQDLYVDRLTKELARVTEQVDLYAAQICAQKEDKQATKEALSEAEMEMASLLMARKQLWQEWNNSLIGMQKRGEELEAVQMATRMVEDQLLSQDKEIQGYTKAITKEQEQNEILTMELNRAQMDNSTTKSQINQKQAQQEAMQARYSTCLRTLRETDGTLAQLAKETHNLEADVKERRQQLEKESALRLELEDNIANAMQQGLTHSKAAKAMQKHSEKLTQVKKEKFAHLWKLENEILAAELESSEIGQNLDNLAFTQNGLNEEMAKMDEQLSDLMAKKASFLVLIAQKQTMIMKVKKKIDQITAVTGKQDLSPQQIEIHAIKTQIEDLEKKINLDHQLWLKRQGTLVELTRELENTNKHIRQLEVENTCMQQEKMRFDNLIQGEHRDQQELQKNTNALRRDLTRLNAQLNENAQLSKSLEQDNFLMQTDFTKKLQAEELEFIKMKMKWEKTAEEKERLLNCLIEAERQIMLLEKKTQIAKETYATVQSKEEQEDRQRMKAEIHRMELRLTKLMQERERLLRESEASVARRGNMFSRRDTLLHSSAKRQRTQGEVERRNHHLCRTITTTKKQMTECEQEIRALQESKASMESDLSQQKQRIEDLWADSVALDQDLAKLMDTKEMNLFRLVLLQNRSKKLQSVIDNTYRPVSNGESLESDLQTAIERVHAVSAIVRQVCQDFPQHKEALRRLTLALAAHSLEKTPELDISWL